MIAWKEEMITAMEDTGMNEVRIRDVALARGIKHINHRDCLDILNGFCRRNPGFRVVQLMSTPNDSLFVSGAASCLEYEEG